MSSFPPPYPYFNGIVYDSAFFASSPSLTVSVANSKYLQKKTPDTATALETFSGGIATANVNSTSSSTNMAVGSNLAASQTLTLGSTGTTTINNGTLQTQTVAPVNPSTNLNIGANSSSSISIGNPGISITNLYGTVQAGTINAFSTLGTVNLANNLVSGGTLNLGGAGNILLNGPTTASQGITTNSISNVAVTDSLLLVNTQTTGDIQLGNGATRSGGIVIGGKGVTPSLNTITIGGGSGTTTTLNSATLNLQAPITPNYTYPISSGKIGASLTWTFNTPYSLSAGTPKNIATITLPIGVYFLQASIRTPTPVNYQTLNFSSASATIQYGAYTNFLTDGYVNFGGSISYMVIITTASTPYYLVATSGDIRTLTQVTAQCFRIA